MTKVRVHAFSVSADGFAAGPAQSLEHPLGVGGMALHQWAFNTRSFQHMVGGAGNDAGEIGIDDEFITNGFDNIGAWILGRNMFGPQRGPWLDFSWRGWWGEDPPYHAPVFVLTHHLRPSLVMAGGTTFHFVSDGIHSALAQAKAAAGNRDVRLGGGVDTLKQFLRAALVDEMHLAMAPTVLGKGESLFADLDLPALGYNCVEPVMGKRAMHLRFQRAEKSGVASD